MIRERICYYCKHITNEGTFCPVYRCGKTGQKKESFDTCRDWEDYEEGKQ